jgi:hypothetical protein
VDRLEQYRDVLATAIATLAIVLSLVTVLLQRRHQQRDTYRQVYETLMSESLHRGRWLLFGISATGELPEDPEDLRLVYRTLGTFDSLAMYVRHRVVPRSWVMDVWHHPLREMRAGVDHVQAADRHRGGAPQAVLWPQLRQLLDEAETYRSDLACCRGPQ